MTSKLLLISKPLRFSLEIQKTRDYLSLQREFSHWSGMLVSNWLTLKRARPASDGTLTIEKWKAEQQL